MRELNDTIENPGPNARFCPICNQKYLSAVFNRVGVSVWEKRMPCNHVVIVKVDTKGKGVV